MSCTPSGPNARLWASDWPPLLLAANYADWWTVTGELLGGLGTADRDAVLGGTATRIYRLEAARELTNPASAGSASA